MMIMITVDDHGRMMMIIMIMVVVVMRKTTMKVEDKLIRLLRINGKLYAIISFIH